MDGPESAVSLARQSSTSSRDSNSKARGDALKISPTLCGGMSEEGRRVLGTACANYAHALERTERSKDVRLCRCHAQRIGRVATLRAEEKGSRASIPDAGRMPRLALSGLVLPTLLSPPAQVSTNMSTLHGCLRIHVYVCHCNTSFSAQNPGGSKRSERGGPWLAEQADAGSAALTVSISTDVSEICLVHAEHNAALLSTVILEEMYQQLTLKRGDRAPLALRPQLGTILFDTPARQREHDIAED